MKIMKRATLPWESSRVRLHTATTSPTLRYPSDLPKGLVEQLLEQHPNLLPPCHSRLTSSGQTILQSLSIAKKLLNDLCVSIPKLYIVVDGLDECEQGERKEFLKILTEIVAKCDLDDAGKLRVVLVSQDYPDIWKALSSATSTRLTPRVIKLSHTDVEKDIHTYVRVWVDKITDKFSPLSSDITEYLCNLTEANAKGMNMIINQSS
jgi:hypothetical protein